MERKGRKKHNKGGEENEKMIGANVLGRSIGNKKTKAGK